MRPFIDIINAALSEGSTASHSFIQGRPVEGATLTEQLHHLGDPAFLYHATPVRNLKSILTHGLQLRSKSRRSRMYGRYRERIYLTLVSGAGMAQALQRHQGAFSTSVPDYVLLKVATQGLSDDVKLFRDPEDKNSVYTETGHVAPAALSVETTVAPELRSRYFAAARMAMRKAGFPHFDPADFFDLSDNAIMFYVDGAVEPDKLATANRMLAQKSPRFGPLEIQNEDGEWGVELVGYINGTPHY